MWYIMSHQYSFDIIYLIFFWSTIISRMGCTLHPHTHSHGGDSHSHEGETHGNGGETHSHGSQGNLNVRVAFIHVIGDILQSFGVFVAAVIIYFKVKRARYNKQEGWCRVAKKIHCVNYLYLTLYLCRILGAYLGIFNFFAQIGSLLGDFAPLTISVMEILCKIQVTIIIYSQHW